MLKDTENVATAVTDLTVGNLHISNPMFCAERVLHDDLLSFEVERVSLPSFAQCGSRLMGHPARPANPATVLSRTYL